ncbi:MAG: SDR family NAD(P)-dependent oxidoreductase [Chloroflexota bacterium]|nr:SDR family NAD(P)-dependent oxidoreductase [Chloroflexota bacterium]MDE2891291.1 SDR family NAD(P)-dependent oxidoreductase [Chloroflexota bacterium]
MRDFTNSTAVVTGAASGMGYAFAERFAAEGMNVVLADIETEALQAAVSRLEQQERSVVGIEVNTMQRESVESLRDQAIDRFGNIHVLCNNAGVTSSEDGGSRNLWEIPNSTWDWVLGVNFYGVLYGIQTFLAHMVEHGEPGHVVNTSSVGGIVAGSGAYSVSKHGVLSLSEGLYLDLRANNSNVSASVLCPGLVNTNLINAERNRPDQFGGPTEPPGEGFASDMNWKDAMDPSNVASLVWDAIVNDTFYILPHPGFDEIVKDRVDRILSRGAPAQLDYADLARRREAGELV